MESHERDVHTYILVKMYELFFFFLFVNTYPHNFGADKKTLNAIENMLCVRDICCVCVLPYLSISSYTKTTFITKMLLILNFYFRFILFFLFCCCYCCYFLVRKFHAMFSVVVSKFLYLDLLFCVFFFFFFVVFSSVLSTCSVAVIRAIFILLLLFLCFSKKKAACFYINYHFVCKVL